MSENEGREGTPRPNTTASATTASAEDAAPKPPPEQPAARPAAPVFLPPYLRAAEQATFRAPKPADPPPEEPAGSSRIRSQPLGVRPAILPEPSAPSRPRGRWRWTPVAAGVAALAWIVALSMLLGGQAPFAAQVSSPRLTLAVVWGVAALLTFAPLEFRLGLPGLTWHGVIGWTLLGYIVAYVPPPTGWLLDLPDLPVYLLFALALFYAVAAVALPLTYLLGHRVYTRRLQKLDLRRSRRQAYEVGLLAVALIMLAALRVLMPLTGLLLVAVFVLVETLLMSQVAPDS